MTFIKNCSTDHFNEIIKYWSVITLMEEFNTDNFNKKNLGSANSKHFYYIKKYII